MPKISRRNLVAALAAAGTTALGWNAGGETAPAEEMSKADRQATRSQLLAYFSRTAPRLLQPAQGILRHPSVSPTLPGAAYGGQVWDWDTLWTSRGLLLVARLAGDHDLHRKVGEHVQGSLLNFFDHQGEDGRLPIMMSARDADFFGCLKTAGPHKANQAKPVMAQLALLIANELSDVRWLEPHFDKLLRFHESWRQGYGSSIGLLVWADDVAVGIDNDPTTFGRPFFSSANLLLNCLYYQDLVAAAELVRRLNRVEDANRLEVLKRHQGERIQKYCWDPRDRFYYTVDVQCVDRRAELIPRVPKGMPMSWQCLPLRIQMHTGFFPMWCGLATPQQAGDLVKLHYQNDRTFHAAFGVRTLSAQETMYSLARSSNPSNWLGPIWVLTNYLVWKGLKSCGFESEANELAGKTLRLLASDLTHSGSLNEYYHPDTGAPLSHHNFMDWNLLVLEMV